MRPAKRVSARVLLGWPCVACLLLLVGSLWPGAAQAQAPLKLSQLQGGVDLLEHTAFYQDESEHADFAQVAAPAFSKRFVPTRGQPISLGFTQATIWLRFEATNDSTAHS